MSEKRLLLLVCLFAGGLLAPAIADAIGQSSMLGQAARWGLYLIGLPLLIQSGIRVLK